MADYIYTMEIRLTPDQQRGVTLVQDIARAAGMNIYLTGGAVRDIISGFTIRDLDFTVQGNPLKLQKDLERAIEQPERRQLQFSKAVIDHPKVRYYLNYFSKNGKKPFSNRARSFGKIHADDNQGAAR